MTNPKAERLAEKQSLLERGDFWLPKDAAAHCRAQAATLRGHPENKLKEPRAIRQSDDVLDSVTKTYRAIADAMRETPKGNITDHDL